MKHSLSVAIALAVITGPAAAQPGQPHRHCLGGKTQRVADHGQGRHAPQSKS